MLNELAIKCGQRAEEKGWHDKYATVIDTPNQVDHVVAKLALITCEVAEAIEEVRAGRDFDETHYSEGNKPEGVPSELADIIIRTLDLAYMLNIDIEKIVDEKLDFNSTRPRLHGKVV